MQTVALLLTARRHPDRLLSVLEECFRQADGLANDERYAFSIFFCDRGIGGSLSEAVAERFPQVRLIRGEAGPAWALGLRTAWQEAAKEDFDFYVWIDAELQLAENALFTLLDNSMFLRHRAIVAGSIADPAGVLRFGGRTRKKRLLKPDPVIPVPCEVFDGMLVLVPRHVHALIGLTDEHYRQGLADYDYGIRAVRAGLGRVIAPGILATTERLPYRPLLRENFRYDLRSLGVPTALWNAVKMYVQQLFTKNEQV